MSEHVEVLRGIASLKWSKAEQAALDAAIDAPSRSGVPAGCEWTIEADPYMEMWNGSCGITWSFTEGGPADNDCNHCPKCGGRIVIAPPTDSRGAE